MLKKLKISLISVALVGISIISYQKIGVSSVFEKEEMNNFAQIKPSLVETPNYDFTPTTNINEIGWQKFPKFHLAAKFKVIYQGARYDSETSPIAFDYGFTHLDRSRMTTEDLSKIPLKKRAWMMGAGFFSQFGSKFSDHNVGILDPFTDTPQKFTEYLANLGGLCANHFHDCPPEGMVATVDVLLWDLENVMYNPDKGRLSKDSPGQKILDNDFPEAYRKAMAQKYRMLTQDVRKYLVKGASVGTYNPGCAVELGNLNPDHYTDASKKFWIWDYKIGEDGKNFKDFMDFQTPGGYFIEDNLTHKDGIYMIVADQEVNARWSNIPRIPVQWVYTTPPSWQPIPIKLAEAMPIFTLMSGAKGMWFWDDMLKMTPGKINDFKLQRNFACYEGYLAGMYRLSKHNAMFEADYQSIIPEVSFDGGKNFYQYNAAELYKKALPIVRAIVTKDKILIAGQNPNPTQPNEIKQVVVRYGKWQDVIVLRKDDIYLGEAKL